MRRDRILQVFQQRSSGNVLLFPYLNFMSLVNLPFGDAAELAAPVGESLLGRTAMNLFRELRKVNLQTMARQRVEELRPRAKGEKPAAEDVLLPPTWRRLLAEYPALSKGAFHRQFSLCEVTERDGLGHRRIVRLVKSEHPGCNAYRDAQRLPLSTSPPQFGRQLLEFLAGTPSD